MKRSAGHEADQTSDAAGNGFRPAAGSGPHSIFGALDRRAIMLTVMIALAVLSQFFRSSNGVIAPELMSELSLDATAIGLSSGLFFVIFAVLQIPIGVLFDRFGVRRVLSVMLLFAVAGSALFALATSLDLLLVGRFLIGFGFAGGMVGSLVVLARWHDAGGFTRVMTILFASANVGSLLATAPLSAANEWIGWRATFVVLALATALITLAFYTVVRDAPAEAQQEASKRPTESLLQSFRGVAELFRIPGFVCLLPLIGLSYAAIVTIIGLWGGPYLHEVHGVDGIERGNLLSVLAVAFIAGTLAYGPIQRVANCFRNVVVAGGGLFALLLLALGPLADSSLGYTLPLLIIACFAGAYSVVLMAHGVSLVPAHLKGRGTTTLNAVLMGGTAALQIGSGAVVETAQQVFGQSAAGFSTFFAGLGALIVLALVIYMRAPDPKRESEPSATSPQLAKANPATSGGMND
jgi:predicted MFS family arabinose efflux permease